MWGCTNATYDLSSYWFNAFTKIKHPLQNLSFFNATTAGTCYIELQKKKKTVTENKAKNNTIASSDFLK